MNNLFFEKAKNIKEPIKIGSYKEDDCIFLLKDISNYYIERPNEEREELIQNGVHYSEMLPIEYFPTQEYIDLFYSTLKDYSKKIAKYTAIVSEIILSKKGKDVILVSLARAGSPVGVLIKRYIKFKYNIDVPHYSISIIRGKGIDQNALIYIINKHNSQNLQFIDGWTGKGVINDTLKESITDFNAKYNTNLSYSLAVLADPSYAVDIYGTREDFLIPSACLNSTISGLVSRSVHRTDIIGENDFHGTKFYKEWLDKDLSNFYIEEICKHFNEINLKENDLKIDENILNLGKIEVNKIKNIYKINDINLIKPGVGETTRVLLRRVPWKILVKDMNDDNLKHIKILAKERNVLLEEFKDMTYTCCGLIEDKKNRG